MNRSWIVALLVPVVFTPGTPANAAPSEHSILSASGYTLWVNAHSLNRCPGSSTHGGEATGGPDGFETWCFEGGAGDSISDGRPEGYVFRSYDHRVLRDDNDSLYWHVDTFQAISGKSMWCGGWNDRTGSWAGTGGGYGNDWHQIMQLTLPGPFNATNGCSLQFKTRYTLGCYNQYYYDGGYDYAYLEYYSFRRSEWRVIDIFNGISGCWIVSAGAECFGDWNNYKYVCNPATYGYGQILSYPGTPANPGATRDYPAYPYVNGRAWVLIRGDSISATPASIPELRFRWRMVSGTRTSAEDGWDLRPLHGIWIDDVKIRTGIASYSETFDLFPVGVAPGAPYSFPSPEGRYDGWAIRPDADPPYEGMIDPGPGDTGLPSACSVNGSSEWSLVADGAVIPPPHVPDGYPGHYAVLASPAIPVNYSDEEGGPFAYANLVVQFDDFAAIDPRTCDYAELRVRFHQASGIGAWSGLGAWSAWRDSLFDLYDSTLTITSDRTVNLARHPIAADVDSIQVAWVSYDNGHPSSECWNPVLPPHVGTQFVVDNISIGLVDAGIPEVHASSRDGLFQDTFNLRSCLHTSVVPNISLGEGRYLLHGAAESLNVEILDPDGLTEGNVQLHYSFDRFASESPGSPVVMRLSVPFSTDPSLGGTWRVTVCDTPWTSGTEVSYFISVEDNLGNTAYVPGTAAPAEAQRAFLTVDILPTPGARILLVDDADETVPFLHPCRLDTIRKSVEDFYAKELEGLGYGFMQPGGYDLYDVNAPADTQHINEPWGFWTANPATPDSGLREYDTVIWATGARSTRTIQDTTQTFLKEFVFHGGSILVTGDRIGEEIAYPWIPGDFEFYGNLLGAEWLASHAGPLIDSDRFPKKAAGAPGTTLSPGDSLHLYAGCDGVRLAMDKVLMRLVGLPVWSHPRLYLRYDDTTSPYDSVAGIYNYVTLTADTGRVVYLPFSLDAVVDQHKVTCDPPNSPFESVGLGTFNGHAELLKDILEIFGAAPRTAVEDPGRTALVNALYSPGPNPMRGEGVLRFSLATPAPVSLAIFDVAGRRVATLVDREMDAGEHAVHWSGRDAAGRPVAAGIYFARMQARQFVAMEKLLVVR